jgi:hypothetical protein
MIISEMQHKLATWAEEDREKRFDRLLRLIARCCYGHGLNLEGEPYALRGARAVRGEEALKRFLLHCGLMRDGYMWLPLWIYFLAKL